MFIIISYDIVDDEKRNKIANILKDYGRRIQYSVFECDINEKLFQELINKIKKAINEDEDSVIFFPLCELCKKKILFIGIKKSFEENSFYVF